MVNNDINSLNVLTPAHLLYGRPIFLYPFFESHHVPLDFAANTDVLVAYNNFLNFNINKFKNLFYKNYLASLQEKHYLARKPHTRMPIEGDIVIVGIDQPKNHWHLGKIVKLIHGSDGLVREAELLSKGTVSRKAVDKLIPLELHCDEEEAPLNFWEDESVATPPPSYDSEPALVPSRRPPRRAAEAARALFKDWVEQDVV